MKNMKDYNEFPPIKYFMRVLKNCPRSALLYTQIWKKSKGVMTLIVLKKQTRKQYMLSPTLVKNMLLPLEALNLVHVIESHEEFRVNVIGIE